MLYGKREASYKHLNILTKYANLEFVNCLFFKMKALEGKTEQVKKAIILASSG